MARRPVQERIGLYCPVKLDNLLHLAFLLRGGEHGCVAKELITGSESVIIAIEFNDREEWIAKLPWKHWKDNTAPDPVKVETEVATMKFVSEHTDIPVPDVFHYSPNCQTSVEWPYILMSKAPGVSLRSIGWSSLTVAQQCIVMRELANILYQLSTIHFDRIGSLIISGSGYSLIRCVRRAFNTATSFSDRELNTGPFLSSKEYYSALLSIYRATVSNPKSTSRFPFLFPMPLRRHYSTEAEFRTAERKYNDPCYFPNNYSNCHTNIHHYRRLCDELETALHNW